MSTMAIGPQVNVSPGGERVRRTSTNSARPRAPLQRSTGLFPSGPWACAPAQWPPITQCCAFGRLVRDDPYNFQRLLEADGRLIEGDKQLSETTFWLYYWAALCAAWATFQQKLPPWTPNFIDGKPQRQAMSDQSLRAWLRGTKGLHRVVASPLCGRLVEFRPHCRSFSSIFHSSSFIFCRLNMYGSQRCCEDFLHPHPHRSDGSCGKASPHGRKRSCFSLSQTPSL